VLVLGGLNLWLFFAQFSRVILVFGGLNLWLFFAQFSRVILVFILKG